MSFFGFDVTLPRDRPTGGAGGGGARIADLRRDEFDPTFDPTLDDDIDDGPEEDPTVLDAKISALTAGAQEDVAVYTWGEEDYDGLGDRLDEAGDTFNDDTFGIGNVGTDFDFGHAPAKPAETKAPAAAPATAPAPTGSKPPGSKFASTLDDFMSLDSKRAGTRADTPTRATAPKTMEEIEAELRASRISQQPVPQPQKQLQPPAQVPSQPGALTMEELEAQMRSARTGPPPGVQQQQPPLQQSQQPPKPAVGDDAIIPDLATIMQQQQMQQAREQEALVSQRFMPPAPPLDPAAAQAAHFARMKSLLDSMSPPVQQAILSLPPPLHFDALMNVIDVFPALQSLQSANLSNPDVAAAAETLQKAAVVHVHETARRQMEEMDKQEAKLRRRLAKIASMAKYNGLMTRSDQDFITRIQVSQLVTPDPYTDDFYAHIYFALRGGRGPSAPVLGQGQSQPEKGRNNNKKQPRLSRRENAMLRMQQQVERIVRHRAERGEKSGAIEGALGKVTTSSTKGMRQMLSVNAKQIGADAVRDALAGASLAQGAAAPGQKRPALNKHEVLRILEKLYDTVLSLEQSRRDASSTDAEALTETLWKELRVLEPLDVSDPHPFVSLLSTSKGKRLLPRALRHLSAEQTLTTMTMIVASFGSLDVVQSAHLLEDASATADREDIERQTEAFANSIVPSMMQLVVGAPMKIVSGMLAVFIERNDAVKVVRSRPGIAFLTIFLSRAESLRQGGGASPEDLEQWSQIFSLLFSRLSGPGMLPSLFPSTRAKAKLPFGPGYYMSGAFGSASLDTAALSESKRFRNIDIEDEPVWNFMAALAVACNMDQQQTLVAELREKILENVISAKEWANRKKNQLLGGLTDELAAAGFPASAGPMPGMDLGPDVRIRNVNLLLHALNLDANQISI